MADGLVLRCILEHFHAALDVRPTYRASVYDTRTHLAQVVVPAREQYHRDGSIHAHLQQGMGAW